MESLGRQKMFEFWKETLSEIPAATDPIFEDFIRALDAHQIWSFAGDENLKGFLSITNGLLNDNRARARSLGVLGLNQFIHQVNPNRFVVIQDSLTSALHSLVKFIDEELVQQLLVNILRRCHGLMEFNQVLTNSVIPKILVYLSADTKDSDKSFSSDELRLLKTCLELFHGPCGNYRINLEKLLLPYIDLKTKSRQRILAFKVIPLLSVSGGGGTKGDKHGQDWYIMIVKILHAMQSTMLQLYSDACPMEEYNPFDIQEFGTLQLPEIRETNVLLRQSLHKTRLENLAESLGYYLSEPFSAVKPVPSRSILNIVTNMLLLNPVDLIKSKGGQEFMYLASVLPSIHESAIHLLKNLINCAGPNLLTEIARIEHITIQEFKWISITPQSFMKLKIGLYQMLMKWFEITKSFVTTSKISVFWMEQIQSDIQVERNIVELTMKSGKWGNKKASIRASPQVQLSTVLTTDEQAVVQKNSELCATALKFLEAMIPSLDKQSHKIAYDIIVRTIMEVTQKSVIPSPFDDVNCRINIFKCILSLALNPHPRSPVSIGILINLVRQSLTDSNSNVVNVCHKVLSSLERIIHPVAPTFNFPFTFCNNEDKETSNELMRIEAEAEDSRNQVEPVDTRTNFCQTDDVDLTKESPLPVSVTRAIESTLMKGIEMLLTKLPKNYQLTSNTNSDDNDNYSINDSLGAHSISDQTRMVNGVTKRKADLELSNGSDDDVIHFENKKLKTDDIAVDNSDCVQWLNDFVNASPRRETNQS